MRFIRISAKIFIFLFLSFVILLIGLYTHAYFSKPIDLNTNSNYNLFDKDSNLVYESNMQKKRVSLKQMNPYLIDAVLSVEDKNFYHHSGFDFLRIIKAMINNIKNGKITEGASTISQQYIKYAYLEFDKTWSRKAKEALMTLNLEMHYEKDEILEAYLNAINYGQGCYGIYEASKYYFNKEPIDLSLEECIILAGIPKNPKNYNPVKSYDNAIKRAKIVALTMLNNNKITEEQYNNLFKEKIDIYAGNDEDTLKTLLYYEDATLEEMKKIPGITKSQIYSGELNVYTTLDLNAQKTLEKEMNTQLNDDKLQYAGVIVDPNTGAIRALIGGRDYNESQYNRALNSKRQVGSTMKPFLYYAALNNGMTSSSTFLSQYTTFNLDGGKTYSPKNYANIYGNKNITMAAAIAYSDNIYAVKTNLFLGTQELIKVAKLCGINEELKDVASLALGTSEINLLDFATGYTTLASGGYKKKLHIIERIEDKEGNLLYKNKEESDLVLNPNYVYILNELLTSPTSSAFIDYNNPTAINIASKLSQKYALKTGTTDTDYWVVGYNKNMLMVSWTGYDDNSNFQVSLSTGAKTIWVNTMEKLKDGADNWYEMPQNVVGIPLDAVDGTPTSNSAKVNMFYYLRGTEPDYVLNTG